MSAPSLSTEAGLAKGHPARRFNERERQLLKSVKTYVDSLSPDTVITSQGDIIIGNSSGDAARLAKGTSGLPLVAGASTVSYAALSSTGLASGSVTLAKLASGVSPSHVVKYAGSFTTAGGDAAESISVSGVTGTDIAIVSVKTAGGTPRSIVAAAAGTDAIDVTMSGDPSTDHVLHYVVYRAAS
jgi:hypothetical protein